MRKVFTLLTLLFSFVAFVSCSDNDDGIYVSNSGEGSLIIGYNPPEYLHRMILFTDDTEQNIYIMGSSAYVDADANFNGRGAVVKLTIPNSDDNTTILAQSFDIDNSDYMVSYNPYVNYMTAEREDDFTTIDSGTVIIRKSGSFYDIRLLGIDSDEDNILISYRGYIYRTLIETEGDSDGEDESSSNVSPRS